MSDLLYEKFLQASMVVAAVVLWVCVWAAMLGFLFGVAWVLWLCAGVVVGA